MKRLLQDLNKLQSFYTAKETNNEMKRWPMEREEIWASDMTKKGFMSRIYKQLTLYSSEKKKKNF